MKTKSFLQVAAVFLLFVLFSMPFGIPERMSLVSRSLTEKSACMVGDRHYDDVVGKLNHRRPEIVLVGNSMLGEAVDEKELEALMHVPVASVWAGGVGSAWWYLVVKNILPLMKRKPLAVGIFFRDNHLTMPSMRVTGKHKKIIDDFSTCNEDLLDRLAYFSQKNLLEVYLDRYVPMFNKRDAFKERLDFAVKRIVSFLFGGTNASKAISDVFDASRMNSAILDERQLADEKKQDAMDAEMPFNPEKTFLEPIVKTCKDMNVSLVFIRVKRRRDLEEGKQPKRLVEYMKQLKTYLQRHDAELIDYTDNAAIRLEHFGEGDHLNRKSGRQLFTTMLAADLKKALSDQPKRQPEAKSAR